MKGHIEVNCWNENPSLMPEKFKGKKTKKAGAAIKEEHLLSFIYVCDVILDTGASMMYMQVDIQEDEEKVSELNTSCAHEAQLNNETHEHHGDDVEPLMIVNDVEVDYEFHNDAVFVQVELSLEDEDVEETEGLSQIRPTLQALNSPNMWIGDTGATRHSTKYTQGGIDSRPSTSRTRGISGQAIKPSMEVDLPGMYCDFGAPHTSCRQI